MEEEEDDDDNVSTTVVVGDDTFDDNYFIPSRSIHSKRKTADEDATTVVGNETIFSGKV